MLIIKSVYEAYKQDIYTYLVSLTHDSLLAEDLLSDTFLGAIRALPRFRGESDIKTWLFSIARHKWYEHLRKSRPTVSLDDLAECYLRSELNVENIAIKRELAQEILRLLDNEPPRTRDIVLMRIEGYSFFEIAQKHAISESSARVIDHRAKKKIKDMLTKEGAAYE
ncbi:MAG: sigma-70 family RNA polymerase sigma factor [Firmicutes bacterium]|nr:sigma-70 family RNA polymerase sigma factor [Bacillota bacterium]